MRCEAGSRGNGEEGDKFLHGVLFHVAVSAQAESAGRLASEGKRLEVHQMQVQHVQLQRTHRVELLLEQCF